MILLRLSSCHVLFPFLAMLCLCMSMLLLLFPVILYLLPILLFVLLLCYVLFHVVFFSFFFFYVIVSVSSQSRILSLLLSRYAESSLQVEFHSCCNVTLFIFTAWFFFRC